MENISHSRQLPSSLSKKTYNGGGSLNFPPSKAIYDDVFGGPPRFGAPSLSPQAEDYAEIFGGFHASRSSSIPVLDLPLVDDDGEVFFDVRSSGFDYDEVFGGFNDSDFAVSYDELVKLGQSNAHGDSSDEAWTPDEAEYLSEESDRAKNQCLLNGDRYEDDSMEFNISYHKACQGSNDDLTNGSSHITQFHAVPGRTFVVDRGTSLPKIDNEYPPLEVSDDDAHFNIDLSGEMLMERSLRKTMSQPANGVSGRPLFENDVEAHREYVRHGSFPNKMFVTISDVSLRTQPSQVPPPSRPPPALDVGNRDSTKLLSNCKGVATGDSSPPYFDVEVDASSSAAVSAAAMKEAMEKAQAKLKSAKELMERKREGFHSRTKSGSKSDKKDKERDFAGAVDDTGITRDERVQGTHEREESGLGIYDVDRQNVMMTTPQIPNSLEGKKLLNLTKNPVEEKHERQCLSSQGSDTVDGASEWKEATQFFELVRPSKSRKTFDQAISDSSFTQNTNIIEHGKKEKKAATESMEQHLENDEKGDGARADNELEEYEKKSAVLEEAWQCEENDGRSGATKIAYRQKVTEKKVQKAQEVSRWKENEKKLRMDRQPLETEKKKTRAHVSQKDENMLDLRFQAKETMKLKEKEPPTEEANRSMEDEKRVVREKEDGERRRREVSKREEKEKNLKAALDQVENEKRLKEALEREEEEKRIKEVREQEENEKKQKEAYEKQENEKRLREALEQEEKEKRLKEAIEKEESERRLKEAIEKEESERRLKEFLEKEERESRLKEALKKEQRERRKKEAIEREENEKRRKEACEREEKEKKLKEAYEREESGKRLNEALEKEENERRLREVLKREEYEKGERESHEREEYEKKLKEALEHEENNEEEKDANEREDTEKRQREAFGRGKNEKRIKEICENKDIGKQIDVELEEEVDDEYLREAQDGKESKGQKEIHDQKQVGDTSQENCNWEDTRIRFKDGGEGEELIGQAKIGKVHSISNETYNLVDKTNLGETQLAGKDEGMTEKMDATGKVVNKETRKVQIGLRCNENDAAGGKEDVWVDGKKEVSGMEDAVRLSHADEQKAGEAGHCIGQRNVEKFKSGTGMSSDVENQGKNFTRERSEKGNNIKLAQVSQNQEDKRDNLSARIVKESVDARRTGATQPVTTEVKGTIQQTSQDVNANQSAERKVKNFSPITAEGFKREKDLEKEHLRKIEEEREREREREKDRMAVDIATLEARERAYSEVHVRAERAAVERAAAEARERAMNEARERLEKTCAEVRERSLGDKTAIEARLRAERAAVERATAEARERAFEKAMAERAVFEARERVVSDKFSASSRTTGMRPSSSSLDSQDSQPLSTGSFGSSRYPYPAVCSGPYNKERSSGVDGESPQRCKARLERHRRTAERAAKALAEKNMRDLLAQKEQAERHRIAETLDAEIKRWSSGKEGNLRALLSTLQYILGPDSGWQPIPLTEVITSAAVKKAYRKATLCVHPDKLQQRGASIQQKYICEKVFDLLKEAWNRFNSEER